MSNIFIKYSVTSGCVQVQGMVCELRAGFSRALLELNQIQQGDTDLQSQLEDTRHGCNKRALHLESLVLSLKVRPYTHVCCKSIYLFVYLIGTTHVNENLYKIQNVNIPDYSNIAKLRP